MAEPDPIPALMERLRGGDSQAPDALFTLYARRLTRVAEMHLSRQLKGRMDGDDVVQSVFRTFFRRSAAGEFCIDSSAQIWKLLVKITLLKARAKGRYHSAGRRAVSAERPGDGWLSEAMAQGPTPEEAAALLDLVEHLLAGLPELYARVLELRLAGYPVGEIAPQLNVSRQTVYRALELLQQRICDSAAGGAR
jgi:RNA polymerase sigma-70 factor (ECF subfamily)